MADPKDPNQATAPTQATGPPRTGGSPFRDSLDRKSAMERSYAALDRSAMLDQIARDNAALHSRYRSRSPMACPPLVDPRPPMEVRGPRFAQVPAGERVYSRQVPQTVHLSPEPVTHTTYVTNMQDITTRTITPVHHQVMQPVRHTVMQRVDHEVVGPVITRERVVTHSSQHQELFIAELTAEINEIKARSRDFEALKDQHRYLQDQYNQSLQEKSQLEKDCLVRISADKQEVDRLIRELDIVKQENIAAEDEQIKLLEMVAVTESEYINRSSELNALRQQSSIEDQGNLNLRKEIEYQDRLLVEQKEISHAHYKDLTNLREIQFNIDKEIDVTSKRYSILKTEIENNEQRIQSISQMLAAKEDQFAQVLGKINEAQTVIQEHKYNLNKLDSELGYLETNNEQHKACQSQLFKANEYEYTQSKDMSIKMNELQVNYAKMEDEEKSLGYEINRLKAHSDQMMKDQVDLQAEVDALDKHMANLNNQNYCLQKELESFIESDEAVRQGLDRKMKVDCIRTKVDDVIRRSEAEVEERIMEQKSRRVMAENARISAEQQRFEAQRAADCQRQAYEMDRARYVTRSANHYSPARCEPYMSRVAYRPGPGEPLPPPRNVSADPNMKGGDKKDDDRRVKFEQNN